MEKIKTGKNAILGSWVNILADYYHLKSYSRQILEEAARQSKTHIRIDLRGTAIRKRELAITFEEYDD